MLKAQTITSHPEINQVIYLKTLSDHCQLPVCTENEIADAPIFLKMKTSGLYLTDGKMELQGDFSLLQNRLRKSNLTKEAIIKAVVGKNANDNPSVIDATAGLGEDSFLLASVGCEITLFEKNPVIAALLRDAIIRASKDQTTKAIVKHMHLFEEDSINAMNDKNYMADVVFLDPMFPEKKKSASVKKKFQLLHQLESPCSDETDLLCSAMKAAREKIVIKRPVTAPPLGNIKPDYIIPGKTIRYDVILIK